MVLNPGLDGEIFISAESYSVLSWLYIHTISFSSIRVTVRSQLISKHEDIFTSVIKGTFK